MSPADSLWDGSLRNSTTDLVIDSCLFVAILGAYIPQYVRLIRASSTIGLSAWFPLYGAFFATHQLSDSIVFAARAYPNSKHPLLELTGHGQLRGWKALGGLFGVVQVALVFVLNVLMVYLFAIRPSPPNAGRWVTSNRFGLIGAVSLHAALFLIPALSTSLPEPKSLGIDPAFALLLLANVLGALFFSIAQFYQQYGEGRRNQWTPGALSLLALMLRFVVSTVLAIRWLLRVGKPTWEPIALATPFIWYEWSRYFLVFFIDGIGCLVLLYFCSTHLRGTETAITDERTPLLA